MNNSFGLSPMSSKQILILHTTLFILFVVVAVVSPVVAIFFPQIFSSNYYLPAVALFMIGVLWSWKQFGGCPFTVWENRMKEKEHPGSGYKGSCMPFYLQKWFGLRMPQSWASAIVVLLVVILILDGIFIKYIF